jgi:1-acyl-sn-glycerol-3-phosphate acyltransferase
MSGEPLVREHAASGAARVAGRRKDTPFDRQAPERPVRWYLLAWAFARVAAGTYSNVQVEGLERVPRTPVLFCFSHQCWIDPAYVLAALPRRPRIYFFGPEQEDMRRGFRNRLMRRFGLVIPFAPGARGLLAATQRSVVLARRGASIAIAGEGRIHCGESVLLPLKEGAAYIALRAGVPLVPVAINGTGWLGFRREVRVRFGDPIEAVPEKTGRPRAAEVAALTVAAQSALELLVLGFDDRPPSGRAGRWLTELFNGWPGGVRPCGGAATSAREGADFAAAAGEPRDGSRT